MKKTAKAYYIDFSFIGKKPFFGLEWYELDPSRLICPQVKSASFNSYEEMMLFADLNEIEVRVTYSNTPIAELQKKAHEETRPSVL